MTILFSSDPRQRPLTAFELPFDRQRCGAQFSEDRIYRYALWRLWDASRPSMYVIGLNPSTADETMDDPTIRRCVGFARREGCGELVMLNLFAVRTTDPKVMMRHPQPIGPLNDLTIRSSARYAGIVVAAWGAHGSYGGRDKAVRLLVPDMRCFGLTRAGQPKHPLYLAADTPLGPFDGAA